jgi:hypothetical protein
MLLALSYERALKQVRVADARVPGGETAVLGTRSVPVPTCPYSMDETSIRETTWAFVREQSCWKPSAPARATLQHQRAADHC